MSKLVKLVDAKSMTPRDVRNFLEELAPASRDIVEALRKVIQRAAPHAVESFVWGGLSYHRPTVGGRVKGAVCQIGVKKGQVRLDFIHGVWLADPNRLLCGNRLSKRIVLIDTVEAAERPEVAALIREAARLEPSELA